MNLTGKMGESKNFKPGGGGGGGAGPGAVELVGSGDCFNVSSHIPYVIAVSAKNKIHTVHIALQVKYMRVKPSKLTKQTSKYFQTGTRLVRRSWIRLYSKLFTTYPSK